MNASRTPLALLALSALLLASACQVGGKKKEEHTEADYAAVARADLKLVVKATGAVEPKQTTRIKSEVSGEILELFVEEGDRVVAGAPIAALDQWRQEINLERAEIALQRSAHSLDQLKRGANVAQIREARAAVESAQIEFNNAKREEERLADLVAQGFAPQRELDGATRARELAEVALNRARADLAQIESQANPDALREASLGVAMAKVDLNEAQREVGNATLTSPVTGTVLEKFVSEGDTVIGTNTSFGEGTILVTLADLANVQVRTNVDEVDIGRVAIGQEAEVEVDAYPGKRFTGLVTNIFPQGIPSSGVTSFIVIIDVPNQEGELLANMTATVNINAKTVAHALLVPFESIRSDKDGKPIVYVADAEWQPEERPVKLGATDFAQVEILEGLKEGEQVMVDNLPQEATANLGGGGEVQVEM